MIANRFYALRRLIPRGGSKPSLWRHGYERCGAALVQLPLQPAGSHTSMYVSSSKRKNTKMMTSGALELPQGWQTGPDRNHQQALPLADGNVDALHKLASLNHPQDGAVDATPAYDVLHISDKPDHLEVLWADGHASIFHYIWLRDNCRCSCCFHPEAKERMIDTHSIGLGIRPTSSFIEGNDLRIIWPKGSAFLCTLQCNCLSLTFFGAFSSA